MHPILKKLSGGTRRSIGRANEVAAEVLAHPRLFRHLFAGLSHDDALIRMRAADAMEKITFQRASLLHPFKKNILSIAARSQQQELRWQRAVAVDIFFDYLHDKSSIVKTFAMQALADLAASDPKLKSQITPLLEELTQTGTPAMRARGRKLLRKL
jgi:HEAT repeat protein